MSTDDFVADYYDYSDRDHEAQQEFTVILDENPCETLVVGGDNREVFVVIDDIHKKRPSEKATKRSTSIKGKRKVHSVVLPTAKDKVTSFRKSRLRRNLVRCSICKKRTSHLKKTFRKAPCRQEVLVFESR